MCGPCVEKYYTSNLASIRKLPKTNHVVFKMIGLTIFRVFPFSDTKVGLLTEYCLKYSRHLLLLLFKVKIRHPCIDDGSTMKGIEPVLQ